MNIEKTKVMTISGVDVVLDEEKTANVDNYIYLGHIITRGNDNLTAEITR